MDIANQMQQCPELIFRALPLQLTAGVIASLRRRSGHGENRS